MLNDATAAAGAHNALEGGTEMTETTNRLNAAEQGALRDLAEQLLRNLDEWAQGAGRKDAQAHASEQALQTLHHLDWVAKNARNRLAGLSR